MSEPTDAEYATAIKRAAVYLDTLSFNTAREHAKKLYFAAQRLESRPSTSGQEISEAIKEVLEASDEFREGMGPEWEGDPLTDACDRLRAAFQAAQKDKP